MTIHPAADVWRHISHFLFTDFVRFRDYEEGSEDIHF